MDELSYSMCIASFKLRNYEKKLRATNTNNKTAVLGVHQVNPEVFLLYCNNFYPELMYERTW